MRVLVVLAIVLGMACPIHAWDKLVTQQGREIQGDVTQQEFVLSDGTGGEVAISRAAIVRFEAVPAGLKAVIKDGTVVIGTLQGKLEIEDGLLRRRYAGTDIQSIDFDQYIAAQLYAWFACVFCVLFTLRCAFAFAQKQPDIFLALCVYAGQWGVLIVYYSNPGHPNYILPALSGYFAAIAGFLIFRRHFSRKDKASHHLEPREMAVAWLLLLVALPRIVATPFGRELLPGVIESDIDIVVTFILDTIGYYALYKAIAVTHEEQRCQRLVLAAPLFIYWLLNAMFAITQLYRRAAAIEAPLTMPDSYRYAFAIAKIVAVVTFVPAVLSPYEPFKGSSWFKRLMVFMHLVAEE